MRLKEEKMLMGLGILSLLIVLDLFFLQIADSKIAEFNNDVTAKQNQLNIQQGRVLNALLNKYWHQDMSMFIQQFKPEMEIFTYPNTIINSTDFRKTDTKNDLRNKLLDEVKEKKRDPEDFYSKMSGIYAQEYANLYNQYHKMAQEYLNKSSSGTKWASAKRCLFLIEMLLIFLNIFGYGYLFKSVSSSIR